MCHMNQRTKCTSKNKNIFDQCGAIRRRLADFQLEEVNWPRAAAAGLWNWFSDLGHGLDSNGLLPARGWSQQGFEGRPIPGGHGAPLRADWLEGSPKTARLRLHRTAGCFSLSLPPSFTWWQSCTAIWGSASLGQQPPYFLFHKCSLDKILTPSTLPWQLLLGRPGLT